jgi:hypothetical protein
MARHLSLVAFALACAAGRPEAAPQAKPPSAAAPANGSAAPDATPLEAFAPSELSATSGEIVALDGVRFAIASPTLRAELGRAPRSAAELGFVYRGPTKSVSALASGELRRQIGLKLRAQDSCNVVYVMWHIEPSPKIVVSLKSNPGQSRHAECGDRGYAVLQPRTATAAPVVATGEPHVLGAVIAGRELSVTTDGSSIWVGELPEAAFSFDGPVGLRSDNGEFSAELRAERLARK